MKPVVLVKEHIKLTDSMEHIPGWAITALLSILGLLVLTVSYFLKRRDVTIDSIEKEAGKHTVAVENKLDKVLTEVTGISTRLTKLESNLDNFHDRLKREEAKAVSAETKISLQAVQIATLLEWKRNNESI